MIPDEIYEIVKNLKVGKEVKLRCVNGLAIGITKQKMLENEYVLFGWFGSDLEIMITNFYDDYEIGNAIINFIEEETEDTLGDMEISE